MSPAECVAALELAWSRLFLMEAVLALVSFGCGWCWRYASEP